MNPYYSLLPWPSEPVLRYEPPGCAARGTTSCSAGSHQSCLDGEKTHGLTLAVSCRTSYAMTLSMSTRFRRIPGSTTRARIRVLAIPTIEQFEELLEPGNRTLVQIGGCRIYARCAYRRIAGTRVEGRGILTKWSRTAHGASGPSADSIGQGAAHTRDGHVQVLGYLAKRFARSS